VSSRKNVFVNYSYSKLLVPVSKSTSKMNGKNWKQKALKVSNLFHSAARLAQSVRGDA
jgi:hypothetical protein